jgi:hypothetical protein
MGIWYILWAIGKFYGHLVYFMGIWYILWPFGNLAVIWSIFPRFGIFIEKNLATLTQMQQSSGAAAVAITYKI